MNRSYFFITQVTYPQEFYVVFKKRNLKFLYRIRRPLRVLVVIEIGNHFNLTVIFTDISRNMTSCRKHSVIAVSAYLQAGYIPLIGLVPGMQVLTLCPKMLLIFMICPSIARFFIDLTASLVQTHNAKIFASSIAFKSFELFSSRSIYLLKLLHT